MQWTLVMAVHRSLMAALSTALDKWGATVQSPGTSPQRCSLARNVVKRWRALCWHAACQQPLHVPV
jgi:hypothetical protein